MGVIKTALEIALEKTENVKSDKSGIDQFKAKQHGKKLANAFLSGEEGLSVKSLVEEINNTPGEQKESLKQGIFDILISQIALPSGQEDEKRFGKIGEGLKTIINNKQFSALFEQLAQVFSQYLQETSHYEQAIRQQYSQRLRQKEEELSRRLGREVRIDPMQDPEFVAFYNQHMNALKSNYEPVIEQAKEEVRNMFND